MNRSFILIFAFFIAQPAFGARRKIKTATPEAPSEKPRLAASSISLQAQGVASGSGVSSGQPPKRGAERTTTAHKSGIQIGVRNLGTTTETVTVKWFWLGRYETSKNFFRADDGEKVLTLTAQQGETVFAEGGDIESHFTTTKKSEYKSGGRVAGWLVMVSNGKGELVAVRASDSVLEGFALKPPAKQR